MSKWYFTFDGRRGLATRYHNALWIVWGGMGFHAECACPELRAAIMNAEGR